MGFAPATEADGFAHFQTWLANGYAGEMTYLHQHADARRHPQSVLPEVVTVMMLGKNYANTPPSPSPSESPTGRVARYAQGQDYHDWIRAKLNELLAWFQRQDSQIIGRGIVDTAPLLERDFARRAGLGWIGKNTMLISRHRGSYLFLSALLLNCAIPPDPVHEVQYCGNCTACLNACPTQAFPAPRVLDATKCISYLTIELKSAIPQELSPKLSGWLFGCDICQEVCPWNRKPLQPAPNVPHDESLEQISLFELLELSEAQFRQRFRGTPLFRTKRRGVVRTAIHLLVNARELRVIPLLERLCSDPEPLLQETAHWAIQQLRTPQTSEPPQTIPPPN
ncbi:tRNA epoxyqueuosine(34) reductase QueG [Tuwongella immobilis]|nr:tRNA epoxyqueuosine(34) reductase QueG [Tuwongella immobilis]